MTDDLKKTAAPHLQSADDVHRAIKKIMSEQLAVEAESPYDRSVCITAVATASDTFERISVTGSAAEYIARVYDAIDKLQDIYVDSSGEFTNGKAPIGGVLDRLYTLRKEIGV